MNKIIIIAVFIFWGAVSVFFINSLLQKNNSNGLGNNQNTNNSQKGTLATELPVHNSKNDCWLAINGKVYNVTDYIYSHPGGSGEIIKYCGQDGTQAFASKDKTIPKDHSAQAYAMLAPYYIGDLNSVSASNNNQGNSTSTGVNLGNNVPATSPANNPAPVTYTLTTAIVAQHNTASDCWVTVGSNVYNVTSYIRAHPGGQSNITRYCGADIGAAYTAQGHSANANNIFNSYKIGIIGSTVSAQVVNTPPATTNQNTGRGDDEEDD